MAQKVVLILVDGMRPDALADIPAAQRFIAGAASSLAVQTVMPSVTLPCHMSLFHSVEPGRHGIMTNIYTPQVRPVPGIAEVLKGAGKKVALFYDWEELRDLSRPGNTLTHQFRSGRILGYAQSGRLNTAAAAECLRDQDPDFLFLYLGHVDEVGHATGWMKEDYLAAVSNSWDRIRELTDPLGDDFLVLVTSDHGGHERMHGTESPDDMLIPLIIRGPGLAGRKLGDRVSILDIAPTITAALGVAPADEWVGRDLLRS